MQIIECIPNVSEGRRPEVVAALVDAVAGVAGVRVLDWSSDGAHNRSVITMVGSGPALGEAIVALYERALPAIDLRRHTGEHPRIGAVDVVPFVPIQDATMADCVALAREVGARVADRFGVPVYLYEEAAATPARRPLEDVRRGEFEGLTAKMATAGWQPDFGAATPHPTAGASAIGARAALVAYNINLATSRLEVAKRIAAAVRFSSGGFRFVKAMGVTTDDPNVVQVSMNLTNCDRTPIFRVFDAVEREASRHGVAITGSQIVGLVPAAVLLAAAEHYLRLEGFTADQVLERRLEARGNA